MPSPPSEFPLLRPAFIGGYGHHYLRGVLDDPTLNLEATAVAGDGRDPAAARRKFAKSLEHHDAAWFEQPLAMLDQFKPTAVSIGGVYAHNSALIVEALRRGVAVVADKPIAATWPDLQAVRDAVVASDGGMLLTEFDFRSRPTFRAARTAVLQGEIGEVVLSTAQKSYRFGDARPDFYRRRADYGSTMLWIASHGIDAVAFVTQQPFARVAAAHGNLARPEYGEFEDHAAALFILANKSTALVHADYLRPAAAATHGDGRCLLTTHDQPERDITDRANFPPQPMHRELLAALLDGDTRWYSTEQSLTTAAALLAARDAADEQTFVDL